MEENILNGLIVKDNVDDHLKCNICLEVFNKPVALKECGHVFCKNCISKWKNNCPNCRSNFSDYIKKIILKT